MTVNELLARFSEQQVAAFFLVLARVSPLFLLAPLFSRKMIPARARGVIAVALTVGIDAGRSHGATIDLDPLRARRPDRSRSSSSGSPSPTRSARCSPPSQAAGALLDTLIGFSFGAHRRPGHRQPVDGASTSCTRCSALLIFVAIDGDAWVIQGLAPHLRRGAAASTRRPSARSSQGAQVAFSGIFVAAFEIARPGAWSR